MLRGEKMGEDLLLDINYSEFENKISLYLLNQHDISSDLVIYKGKDNYTLSDGVETPSIFLTQNMNDIPDGLRTPIVSLESLEIDGPPAFDCSSQNPYGSAGFWCS